MNNPLLLVLWLLWILRICSDATKSNYQSHFCHKSSLYLNFLIIEKCVCGKKYKGQDQGFVTYKTRLVKGFEPLHHPWMTFIQILNKKTRSKCVWTWLSSINWQNKLQKCSKLKFLKFEICKTFLNNKISTFYFWTCFLTSLLHLWNLIKFHVN